MALGPNAQLIMNLVPALELVIGRQPPVPDLPPQESRKRRYLGRMRSINPLFCGSSAAGETMRCER
jgi:predicted ATPase